MRDGIRNRAQQNAKLAAWIDEVTEAFGKLKEQAGRAAIGVRSALAKEMKGLEERIENLRGQAWDLRRQADLTDDELRAFDQQRKALTDEMKALQRQIK